MQITQLAELMNSVSTEILGNADLVQEDLSNTIELGNAILNATSYDHYVKVLANHIGRVIIVNKKYVGRAPSVYKDSWEYGSIMEKIRFELPTADDTEDWALEDNTSYADEEHMFRQPVVSAKFFNDRTTFTIPVSVTERQVKESFSNAQQLNGFVSGLFTAVDNALTIKNDAMVMRTINNFIANSVNQVYAGDGNANVYVNILSLYNETLPVEQQIAGTDAIKLAITNPDFIRFANYVIGLYKDRLQVMNSMYNIGKKANFTTADKLHTVLLSDFAAASKVFLESDTYHNELVQLQNYETVPYWQAPGATYDIADTSRINVITQDSTARDVNGILGVMFDENALGVTNFDSRVTSQYTASADFTNYWFKVDAGYFNDFDEQFIVFVAR